MHYLCQYYINIPILLTMKYKTITLTFFIIIIFSFFSCSEKDVALYHPSPGIGPFFVEEVKYPATITGLVSRANQAITYNSNDKIATIKDLFTSLISVQYQGDKIYYTRTGSEGLDRLIISLNTNDQIKYAIHEVNGAKHDSTVFVYDQSAYFVELKHFVNDNLIYSEQRTITNGNVTEINTSSGYQYLYTYDNSEFDPVTNFCIESPLNTITLQQEICWFLSSLPFVSEYLGEKNKNNVSQVKINLTKNSSVTPYATINYQYILNDDNLIGQAKMTGSCNGNPFTDVVTSFGYWDKGKENSSAE